MTGYPTLALPGGKWIVYAMVLNRAGRELDDKNHQFTMPFPGDLDPGYYNSGVATMKLPHPLRSGCVALVFVTLAACFSGAPTAPSPAPITAGSTSTSVKSSEGTSQTPAPLPPPASTSTQASATQQPAQPASVPTNPPKGSVSPLGEGPLGASALGIARDLVRVTSRPTARLGRGRGGTSPGRRRAARVLWSAYRPVHEEPSQ